MRTDVDCPSCGAPLTPGTERCTTCGRRVPRSFLTPAAPGDPAPGLSDAPVDTGWHLGLDVEAVVAPVGRRLAALLVDQLVAAALIGAAVIPALRDGSGTLLLPVLVALAVTGGQWVAESLTGATLGSALLRVRTRSARTGGAPGLVPVLVRGTVQTLGALLGWVGVYVVAASGAWDESPARRGWHDRAAGTVVLRAGAVAPAARPAVPPALAPVLPELPPALAPVLPELPSALAPVLPDAPPAPGLPVDTLPVLPRELVPPVPADLGDLELTRVAGPRAEVRLRLVFDTGERVDVAGPGLIGRQPTAPAGGPEPTHLIAITDPAQSVSRVHLAFHPAPGGLVVADQGSTNGTVLVDPRGNRWALPAGQSARVSAGWSVVFGERAVVVAHA